MRKIWLCLALSAAQAACSGGRDPAKTVGGNREFAGPGAPDSVDDTGSQGQVSNDISTLEVLCIKACAHAHAKDCDGTPANETDSCENQCKSEVSTIDPVCADEAAAVYACTIDANITCTGGFSDVSMVNGCDDKTSDLQKCTSPGSDCTVSPKPEEICLSMGLPTFLICSEGVEPPIQCLPITNSAFCCP